MLVQQAKGLVGSWDKLARVGNVLRYYRAEQLVRRGVGMLRPSVFARRPQRILEKVTVREEALGAFRGIAETRVWRCLATAEEQRDDLARGCITLLGEKRSLGSPIDWAGGGGSDLARLWGFQLHYQEYLSDLAASVSAEDSDAWRIIWETVGSWITGNPSEDLTKSDAVHPSDAWHPYCVSRRLPIWAQLYALCPPPQELEAEFLTSFATQAEWLSGSLEFDLGGNHLLENLRALALAGCFLEGPRAESWLYLVERHLPAELARQVLPSGEHFERSPMYHCQVLGNLLQVGIAARAIRPQLSGSCLAIAAKMGGFLEQVLHPDGEIPLFGDSCFGEAFSVEELDRLAAVAGIAFSPKQLNGATVTGNYWVWRDGEDALIFDAGPVGADCLPAHAHCDLLGFEASVGGQRWFVDSGVYDYSESSMRDYCRSSLAHNVVTFNNQNCCDIWSRFRMGRRGRVTRFEHGKQGSFAWCLAGHDGYRSLGLPQINRLLVAQPEGGWACVESAPPGQSAGTLESGELVGRLHLALGMRVESRGPQQLELRLHDTVRWLGFPLGTEFEFAEGWYCDRFGKRTRTQVISYWPTTSSADGTLFGWWFEPKGGESELSFPGEGGVQFAAGGEVFEGGGWGEK
ncbi:heparinase II/III family protein [Bythopirellula polymerisocia]|nr:heparinase II/III family protein [Bythopirellula polymerisocia]